MKLIITIAYAMAAVANLVAITGGMFLGEVASERSIVHVIQSPVHQSGSQVKEYIQATSGECISVTETHVPTLIQLGPETDEGSYRILGFSTECSEDSQLDTVASADFLGNTPLILNKRHPICSFQVAGRDPVSNGRTNRIYTVFKQSSRGRTITYREIAEEGSCSNICSSPVWDPYVQRVEMIDSKNLPITNNYVNIFADSNCTHELAREVGHGADLVSLTLMEGPNRLIKSFVVNRKDASI